MAETFSLRGRSIPERSPVTAALIDYLRQEPTALDDAALRTIAGMDVGGQGRGRGYLLSARRYVEREYGLVYLRIRGVGLRLQTAEDSVETGACSVRRMHREGKRGIKKMSCADRGQLSPQDQIRWDTQFTLLAAAFVGTHRRARALIEERVAARRSALACALQEWGEAVVLHIGGPKPLSAVAGDPVGAKPF